MPTSNPWLWLLFAGCCEVVYAATMPYTQSFTKGLPSVAAVTFIALSMYGLSVAVHTLPVGTAYAVWVGIGAVGTAVFGIFFLNEPRDPGRLLGIALVVVGVALLKLTHK